MKAKLARRHRKICGETSVRKIVHQIQILVNRVFTAAAQSLKDPLNADPLPFVGRPPLHSLLAEFCSAVCPGSPEKPVKIFLSRSAAGAVHAAVKKIHIQVIPGDIIDLEVRPVPFKVAGDLFEPAVSIFFGAGLSEGFRKLFPFPCVPLLSVPHTDSGRDQEKYGDETDHCQICFHQRFNPFILIMLKCQDTALWRSVNQSRAWRNSARNPFRSSSHPHG